MKDFIVNDEESLGKMLARVRAAQAKFATYTQEQVDKIFFAAALAANKMRIPLAKMAVAKTVMNATTMLPRSVHAKHCFPLPPVRNRDIA